MGLEMEDESLADYRLLAWASLAPFEKIKDLTPLTLSPQVAMLLVERANLILGGKPGSVRRRGAKPPLASGLLVNGRALPWPGRC
jgi:hypothetical protein